MDKGYRRLQILFRMTIILVMAVAEVSWAAPAGRCRISLSEDTLLLALFGAERMPRKTQQHDFEYEANLDIVDNKVSTGKIIEIIDRNFGEKSDGVHLRSNNEAGSGYPSSVWWLNGRQRALGNYSERGQYLRLLDQDGPINGIRINLKKTTYGESDIITLKSKMTAKSEAGRVGSFERRLKSSIDFEQKTDVKSLEISIRDMLDLHGINIKGELRIEIGLLVVSHRQSFDVYIGGKRVGFLAVDEVYSKPSHHDSGSSRPWRQIEVEIEEAYIEGDKTTHRQLEMFLNQMKQVLNLDTTVRSKSETGNSLMN